MVELNNYRCEFGYEMISLYPYAYYLHKQGKHLRITTNKGMKPFYFFADEVIYHEENRNWFYEGKRSGVEMLIFDDVPNAAIHKPELDLSKFETPDLKYIFANKKFHKDSIYIANRYNKEWIINPELNRPINFFDLDILDQIFRKFKDRQIYYFSTYGIRDYEDGTPQLQLNDYEFCQNYHNVIHIKDVYKCHDYGLEGYPLHEFYNLAQLQILSNCSLAITMNGGCSILASYFPLRNVIYYKPVKLSNGSYAPKEHETKDYGYYNQFNKKNEICVVNSYEEILNNI